MALELLFYTQQSLKLHGSKMEKVKVRVCGRGTAGDTELEDGLSKAFLEKNGFIDVDSVNISNRQFHLLYSDLVAK